MTCIDLSWLNWKAVGDWLYNWQTLITGFMALVAAFVALQPVRKQLKLMRAQNNVMVRDTIGQMITQLDQHRASLDEITDKTVSEISSSLYAQAGMVGLHARDLFIDGKMSLLTPIAHGPLRIGASLSGGAQPQVERLDIGPELQIRLPLPRIATRIAVEWRERIAGRAAPASGVALTLAADF